jgi:hypothetical protein
VAATRTSAKGSPFLQLRLISAAEPSRQGPAEQFSYFVAAKSSHHVHVSLPTLLRRVPRWTVLDGRDSPRRRGNRPTVKQEHPRDSLRGHSEHLARPCSKPHGDGHDHRPQRGFFCRRRLVPLPFLRSAASFALCPALLQPSCILRRRTSPSLPSYYSDGEFGSAAT